MANTDQNVAMRFTSGTVGKQLTYKTRNGKSYVSAYPDKSKLKWTKEQGKRRRKFSEAVKFAQKIMADPEKQAQFPAGKGKSAFNAAVSLYMTLPNGNDESVRGLKKNHYTEEQLQQLSLSRRQIKAVLYLQKNKELTNAGYKKLNNVSKATATRDLQDLVSRSIFQSTGFKGVGASYVLIGS